MSLINSLETKLGRFAIPGLVNILVGFQVAVWVMILAKEDFLGFLVMHRGLVLQGEVWRLVTWAFIPSTLTPIGILLMAWVSVMIGRALEQAWGAFRVNVYIFGGMLSIIIGAMIFGYVPVRGSFYVMTTLFLAFAMLYPNQELLLFFILPVKVKYLGMISGALLVLDFMRSGADERLLIAFSVVNFLVAFVPSALKGAGQRAEVSHRRAKFEAAKVAEGTHFHQCKSCGKTDLSDPKLEFRVAGDDEEYCVVCLAKKTGG